MKKLLLPAILILLAGCDYEVPLSQTASAPANQALAGSWSQQDGDKQYRMNIQTSGNDYVVTYGEAEGTPLTLKGFEVSAAGLNLIQLKLQGAETATYLFVKYELTADSLSVCRLNPDVVSAKCQTAGELTADIEVHRRNPFLFSAPLRFTRCRSNPL
jgi:hypothetical protein